MTAPSQDELKAQVGHAAAELVEEGMKLGIGTGSTAEAFVRSLAVRVKGGLNIIGVPTSERTHALCLELGVPLTTLEETPRLDMTIDGADEMNPALELIKGGGGALLREKIVAAASDTMVVIADDSKLVETLGEFPLPIEVNRFGLAATHAMVDSLAKEMGLGEKIVLRKTTQGDDFITDGGHLILDASFGRIVDAEALEAALNAIPGVVENGLFTGLASRAILATPNGIKVLDPI